METVQEPALKKEIVRLEQKVFRLQSVLDEKDSQPEKLKHELLHLRRRLFGGSSERYAVEDPNLLKPAFGREDMLAEESQACPSAAKETLTYERRKRKENPIRPVRQPLPAHLEPKEEIIESEPLPEDAKCIGDEVTEVPEYTPGTLYVRRIVCRKYALAGGHAKGPSPRTFGSGGTVHKGRNRSVPQGRGLPDSARF
jgi:hypothetical protein